MKTVYITCEFFSELLYKRNDKLVSFLQDAIHFSPILYPKTEGRRTNFH